MARGASAQCRARSGRAHGSPAVPRALRAPSSFGDRRWSRRVEDRVTIASGADGAAGAPQSATNNITGVIQTVLAARGGMLAASPDDQAPAERNGTGGKSAPSATLPPVRAAGGVRAPSPRAAAGHCVGARTPAHTGVRRGRWRL
jgi:hypothetical protein